GQAPAGRVYLEDDRSRLSAGDPYRRETWLTAVPKAYRKAEEAVRETYWRPQRRKPPKSRNHDRPWPGAVGGAPRRWFPYPPAGGPGQHSGEWGVPMQIAVSPSPWEPRTTSLACKWRWPTSQREYRQLLHKIRRVRENAPQLTPYWRGVKGRPVTRGLAAMVRQLPDDDALARLAASAAIEAE